MLKKITILAFISLFLYSCGTILKPYQTNKPHSDKFDITIVLLDAVGLLFFILPGVVAYTVDYLNGTLYLPNGRIALDDTSDETIQKALLANGYEISLEQMKTAKMNAVAK